MANRYWVGGTASWDATAGSKWATTSGGAGGQAVPTGSDDVFFDAASGAVTVTLTISGACASINFTGYTGTFAGTTALNVASSLTMGSGMTVSYTGDITMSSTSTGKTLTFNGKTPQSNFIFNGAGGGWTLQDDMSVGNSKSVTLTAGTLDTNGKTVTAASLSSNNSNTRTLTLGASTINLSNGGLTFFTSTNMTFNANTSTIAFTGRGQMLGGGKTFNNITVNAAGDNVLLSNLTCANLTRIGTAVTTDGISFAGNVTVTTLFTVTGNSTANRVFVHSSALNTARTITVAAVSLTNADFQDITTAGAAGTWTGTSLGNAGGNTGITFTSAVTRYWVGTTGGSWGSTSNWATSSGGSTGASIPLIQDTAVFDANSITSGSRTVTLNMPRLSIISSSGLANNPTLAFTSVPTAAYGDFNITGFTPSGTKALSFNNRTSINITSGGATTLMPITFNMPSGTVVLQDDFTNTGTGFTFTNGTFNANGFNVTCTITSVAAAMTLTLGSGTWSLAGTGTVWPGTGTISAASSTIKLTNSSATGKTFAGGGKTYGNIWLSGGAGTGTYTITGANTFNDFKDTGTAAHSVILPAGVTTTITSFTVSGNSGAVISVGSSSASVQTANIVQASGSPNMSYVAFADINLSGGATWNADATCTDTGRNGGIYFNTGSGYYVDNYPGAAANSGATVDWSSPTNAIGGRGLSGQAATSSNSSKYLYLSSYGFQLPSTATITGIRVVPWYATPDGPITATINVFKGGTAATTPLTGQSVNAGAGSAETFYGTTTALWGETWAYTDINASTFGSGFKMTGGSSNQYGIDTARVRVHYTATVTTTKTETGVSRISASTTKTETGVSRITKTTQATETGVSRIQKATSQTETGVSRIGKVVNQTITGLSRVSKVVQQTITGLSRVTASTLRTIAGVTRVTAATARTISAVSRMTASTSRTITGLAKVTATTLQTITGTGRITASTTKTETGIADIRKTTTKTETAVSRIQITSSSTVSRPWTPADGATLPLVWLDAAQITGKVDGDPVNTWADSSGNGFDAVKGTYTAPTYETNELNGLPIVRFVANSSAMRAYYTQTGGAGAPWTMFVLAKQRGGADNRVVGSVYPAYSNWLLGWHQSIIEGGGYYNGGFVGPGGSVTNTFRLFTGKGDGMTGYFYAEGNTPATVGGYAAYQNPNGAIALSGYDATGMQETSNADIAEVIHYDGALSDPDREKVEGYLAWKWGKQADLPVGHTYKSAAPTVGASMTGKSRVSGITPQTETGKGRITATTSNTTTGKARVQKSSIATETGLSRIQKSGSSNETAVSRIQKSASQTETAISRVSGITTKTKTGVARTQKSASQTNTGLSRIQKSGSQTETGLSRITASTQKTITAISRMTASSSATKTGKSRITASTQKTEAGVARITNSSSQTKTGKSRMQVTTQQNVTAVSRITKVVSQIESGLSRLQKSATSTITGKANIIPNSVTTTKTIDGVARVQKTASSTELGVSRLQKTASSSITATSRLQKAASSSTTGKANIRKTATQTETGLASIVMQTNRTETGLSRITKIVSKTVTGVASIVIQRTQTITGKGRLQKSATATESGQSRIQKIVNATIAAVSRITNTSSSSTAGKARLQKSASGSTTGVSRIRVVANRTETGLSRITRIVPQTITGIVRITSTTLKVITGVGRIMKAATKTITGISRVQKAAQSTETGKARITATTPRNQTGVARIQKTASSSISGVSRIGKIHNEIETGKAFINNQRNRTVSGTAKIVKRHRTPYHKANSPYSQQSGPYNKKTNPYTDIFRILNT